MPRVQTSLSTFLASLDRYSSRVALDVLARGLRSLDLSLDEVSEFVKYDREHYRRNLMHTGPAYQALILCWLNGQRSPIHDHRGSSCGVRVLKGVATETRFVRNNRGLVFPTASVEHSEGFVCATQDADIHQISNLQPDDEPLITLHVYSPPLLRMGTYSLTDTSVGEFVDPVYEFADGAGI